MISIIIPSFNEQDEIINTLDAISDNLKNNNEIIEYEIIVVDSSTDNTFKIIEGSKYFRSDNHTFIHRETKLFPGEARNQGIKASKYNIIVFVDSGFSFENNWFINLVTPLLENPEIDIAWGITKTSDKNKKDKLFAFLFEKQNKKRRVLPNMAVRKKVFYDGNWFLPHLRAVEDTKFIKDVSGKYKEVFTEAINYYSGHPSSMKAAFKKWSTYSYYSFLAGYKRKAKLSIAQGLFYLLLMVVFNFYSLLLILLFQILRISIRSNRDYKINAFDFIYVLLLSFVIDFGRLHGSIKGLLGR